jgi:hypothetical protein
VVGQLRPSLRRLREPAADFDVRGSLADLTVDMPGTPPFTQQIYVTVSECHKGRLRGRALGEKTARFCCRCPPARLCRRARCPM